MRPQNLEQNAAEIIETQKTWSTLNKKPKEKSVHSDSLKTVETSNI